MISHSYELADVETGCFCNVHKWLGFSRILRKGKYLNIVSIFFLSFYVTLVIWVDPSTRLKRSKFL